MEKLVKTYKSTTKSSINKKLGNKNINQAPDIVKVNVNMGFGQFKDNKEYVAEALDDISKIAGQKPYPRYAKKAISSFKLRQGELIGYSVTLRGEKAWDFVEKLIKIVFPGVRDFRGLNRKAFDGKGNYSLGIKEHFVFPEINPDKVKFIKSLQITIVTNTQMDEQAEIMLESIGFPFKKKG